MFSHSHVAFHETAKTLISFYRLRKNCDLMERQPRLDHFQYLFLLPSHSQPMKWLGRLLVLQHVHAAAVFAWITFFWMEFNIVHNGARSKSSFKDSQHHIIAPTVTPTASVGLKDVNGGQWEFTFDQLSSHARRMPETFRQERFKRIPFIRADQFF